MPQIVSVLYSILHRRSSLKEPKFPEKTEVEFEDPDETIHIYTHCVWLKRIKTPRKIISEFPGINYAHLHRVS